MMTSFIEIPASGFDVTIVARPAINVMFYNWLACIHNRRNALAGLLGKRVLQCKDLQLPQDVYVCASGAAAAGEGAVMSRETGWRIRIVPPRPCPAALRATRTRPETFAPA